MKTLNKRISWAQAQFQAALERLSVEWLPEGAESSQVLADKRALMENVVAWACALPVICLVLLLPVIPATSVLIIALISSGLCFLIAGILAQIRAIKLTAVSLITILGAIFISIVLVAGGINSGGSLLLIILFSETVRLSRRYLSPANSHFILLATIGVVLLAMLSSLANGNLLYNGNLVPGSLFWFQCLTTSLACLIYAMVCAMAISRGQGIVPEFSDQAQDTHLETCARMEIAPEFLNAMPGLVTRHDSAGNILATHGADKNILGQDLINHQSPALLKHIHVADRITYLAAIDDLRQKKPVAPIDLRFETNQGFQPIAQFTHLTAHFIPQYDANGILLSFYVQFQASQGSDEYEKKYSTREHKDCELELSKTRFLAGVSHELRTPLNSIMGFSDILLHEIAGPLPNERMRDYVQNIRQSSEHLLNVVNVMLDMGKIQNGQYTLQKESFDITNLLARVEDMLKIQADKKDILLIFNKGQILTEIHADMRALMQILINLVGNAIKFTDQGGTVTLSAFVENSQLILKISDTGIGIAQDKLNEIGQPFTQVSSELSRNYEGTGLGLSLVKGLVSLHNGTFDISSRLGHGTDVTVSIPQLGESRSDKLIDFSASAKSSFSEEPGSKKLGPKKGNAHVA